MRKTFEILIVDDSPTDVLMAREAFGKNQMISDITVVEDGVEALAYLRKEGKYRASATPDLIVLDLNLPRKDGREVLIELKQDEELKSIPVVILTTSKAEDDVLRAYELHANCFITKPVDFKTFEGVVRSIENFWFNVVTLPETKHEP